MPLKLNVGASRKVTDNNYGSRGASVNLELELDTALASDPPKLQEKIRHLFGLVRVSLAEELNGGGNGHSGGPMPVNNGQHAPGSNGLNGHNRQNGERHGGVAPATANQCKALHAIARTNGVVLGDFLRERYQKGRPDDLNIRQASQAIDELKAACAGVEG